MLTRSLEQSKKIFAWFSHNRRHQRPSPNCDSLTLTDVKAWNDVNEANPLMLLKSKYRFVAFRLHSLASGLSGLSDYDLDAFPMYYDFWL